jgi:carbon storage regulator
MLVLTRKIGERIVVADVITIVVLQVHGNRARIGIQAPPDVSNYRQEIEGRLAGKSRPHPCLERPGHP